MSFYLLDKAGIWHPSGPSLCEICARSSLYAVSWTNDDWEQKLNVYNWLDDNLSIICTGVTYDICVSDSHTFKGSVVHLTLHCELSFLLKTHGNVLQAFAGDYDGDARSHAYSEERWQRRPPANNWIFLDARYSELLPDHFLQLNRSNGSSGLIIIGAYIRLLLVTFDFEKSKCITIWSPRTHQTSLVSSM